MIELRDYENKGILKEEYDNFSKKLRKFGKIVRNIILSEFKRRELKSDYYTINSSVSSFENFLHTIYERNSFEEPFKNISDLLEVRIILYYKSQIQEYIKIISRLFDIIPEKESSEENFDEKRIRESYIITVKLSKNMKNRKFFEEFKDFSCNIQIITLIQNMWDLIQNNLDYKFGPFEDQKSNKFKRKLRNLSAQLEIADNELDSIYKSYMDSLVEDRESLKLEKSPFQMIRKIMANPDLFFSTCNDFLKKKKFGELLEFCNESIKIDSKYEFAWLNRGIALTELENLKEAEISFNKALKINPNNNATLYHFGLFYERIRNFDRAIESFNKLLNLYPSDKPALRKLGSIYYITKNTNKSISIYKKLLKLEPNSIIALNYLGILYLNLEEFNEAREMFEKALKLKPKNSGILNNLGIVLLNLNENKKALTLINKSIDIDPNNLFSWLNKGRLLLKLSRFEQALECFDKALEFDPYDKNVLNEKGLALTDMKNYEEAIRYFDRALEVNPNFTVALANKGVVLINLNRLDEAEFYFHKILNIDSSNANSYYNLACLEALKNDTQKALSYLEQSIIIDKSFKVKAKNEKDFESIKNHPRFEEALGFKNDS